MLNSVKEMDLQITLSTSKGALAFRRWVEIKRPFFNSYVVLYVTVAHNFVKWNQRHWQNPFTV